jgi:ATP-dependent helicase HepA
LSESLSKGRDRLLEYNSCRPAIALSIKTAAEQQDRAAMIQDYMEQVYDCFGIDFELHSEDCYVLHPTEHMVSQFPGLSDEGTTVTYLRDTALSYEDAQYLSWEHPMVSTAMDMVLSRESGNTSLVAVRDMPASLGLTAGGILLECLFSLEAPPVEALQSDRYLPPTMIRVVCDEKGRDISSILSHEAINGGASFVEQGVAVKVIAARRKLLKAMQKRSESYANNRIDTILTQAHENARQILDNEINRLNALSKVNPNIRADEINYFEKQLESLNTLIDQAGLRFDAMRVIVVT